MSDMSASFVITIILTDLKSVNYVSWMFVKYGCTYAITEFSLMLPFATISLYILYCKCEFLLKNLDDMLIFMSLISSRLYVIWGTLIS